MTGILYERHSGEETLARLEEITDFYEEIHSEDADDESHELFSRDSFISRTTDQAQVAGFKLVTATLADALVGFSFGYPLPPGKWWGECTSPPDEVLASSKLAVIELNVREHCRRQGIGKKLLSELLAGRPEKFATLATETGSTANAMYLRWGWRKVGFFLTPPPMDALVIPLAEAAVNKPANLAGAFCHLEGISNRPREFAWGDSQLVPPGQATEAAVPHDHALIVDAHAAPVG